MFVSVAAGVAVLGFAGLSLVGPASVPDTDPPGDGPADTESVATTPEDEPSAESPLTDEELQFQLDMMLGLVPDDEMQAYYEQDEQKRQEEIQECMNGAGFEYNPETQSGVSFDGQLGLSSLEYAEQWGFGVYTTMDPETNPFNDVDQNYEWPNQEIIDGMTEAEQTSWFTMFDRCQNETYDDQIWNNSDFQRVMEDFNTLITTDPRVVAAEKAWRECMSEAGHPYASQEEMYDEMYSDNQQSDFYESSAWEESSPDHAAWQAAVDNEIAVAVANVPCSEGLSEVYQTVSEDLRPQFVELWQTIDWNAPPVTYPDEFSVDGDVPFGTADVPIEGADSVPTTNEPQGGLDLSAPATATSVAG
ncbi:hypothetical protein BH24ACT5_BH24ACT5_07100 [soil metagenome]